MRAVLFILIIAVVAVLAAIATGFLDISQTRQAQPPEVSVDRGGVAASGGQAPTFDIETGSVSVGARRTDVVVPTVKVNPPDNSANAVSGNAANAVANNTN